MPRNRLLPLLIAGAFLFQSHAYAAWVYTCEPSAHVERTWTFSNDVSGACDGGGSWVEITSLTEQGVTQEDIEELLAAIAMILVIAYVVRLVRKQFFKET